MARRWMMGLLAVSLTGCSGDGELGTGTDALENPGVEEETSPDADTDAASPDQETEESQSPRELVEGELTSEGYVLGGMWENPGVAEGCVVPDSFADATVVGGAIDFEPVETWTGYFGAEGFSPGLGTFTLYVKSRTDSDVKAAIVFDQELEMQYSPMEPTGDAPAGYAFSVFDSVVNGDRWDFKVRKAEWLRDWCESRASYAQGENVWPEFACTVDTAKICIASSNESLELDTCWISPDDEMVAYEVSMEEMARCIYACECNSCGCTAESTDEVMDFHMLRSGNEMHGLEELTATSPTIHMTLVE